MTTATKHNNRLEAIASRFQQASPNCSGYQARCPAHDDHDPSLSISVGDDGKVLLHCHAGCSFDEVCQAAGLDPKGLFPEPPKPKSSKRRIVATYDYHDGMGVMVYQVVRYEPKDFKQRRPDGSGGWHWSLKGTVRVLYNLLQLLAASTEQPACVTEGEKDADNLIDSGFVATTNAGGAGKWGTINDVTVLHGRDVVIFVDKDAKGRAHGQDVANRLFGKARSIRLLEMPGTHKDVSEWLEAGGSREELLCLISAAPAFDPSTGSDQGQVNGEADDEPSNGSHASKLAHVARNVKLIHHDEVAYAIVPGAQGGVDCLAVRSRKFRNWLTSMYYGETGAVPPAQSVNDTLVLLEGKAFYQGTAQPVYVRLAHQNGIIYLDLADAERNVAVISAEGWHITNDVPMYFRRPKGVLPIATPVRGGSLRDLLQFINLGDEVNFILLVAWLVAALRPDFPMPILVLTSEQGSGKSTTCRMLRRLFDPNRAAIRCAPRDARDLMIAASNGLTVALDNLSHVPDWLSDALCRLSTGGGFGTRTLYENNEEELFDALRPVILNGIDDLGTRSDLLDRGVRISLPGIPEDKRQSERELMARFDRACPVLLGALLDAVVMALRNIDNVHLDRAPRMADFAMWIAAAEPALPWAQGDFMRVYTENRDAVHELAMEASPVGEAVLQFAQARSEWTGKASALLPLLAELVDEATARQSNWPKKPNALSNALLRIAPNLRALGVEVGRGRSKFRRSLTIRLLEQKIVTTVTDRHQTACCSENPITGDDQWVKGDDPVTITAGSNIAAMTQGDDGDDQSRQRTGARREVAEL